eukprot:COSAG02_NODE_23179_length_727_cov_1.113057_1_plen_43_part_01
MECAFVGRHLEERVYNLGTPGPSDRTRRTPISRVRFGISNLGT